MHEVTSARPSDRVAQLQAQLTDEVARLVDSTAWQEMLQVAARFHHYSARNVLLIGAQCPEATRVAGFQRWRELGRFVRKGEHGIKILAPCVYQREETNGEKVTVLRGFKIAHVFDISQTDGAELPDVRPQLLTGEGPAGLWEALAELVTAEGFTLALEGPSISGANGETDWSARAVRIRPDLEPAARVKTLAHELGHIRCDHFARGREGLRREIAEIEAESVAFIVLGAMGTEAGEYSAPYVASWGDSKLDTIQDCAQRVIEVSRRILRDLGVDEEQTSTRSAA